MQDRVSEERYYKGASGKGWRTLKEVYIVIPALEPSEDFPGYIRTLRQMIRARTVVIDDGSGAKYAGVFQEIEAMPGCRVLHHSENQGKGRALKTGYSPACSGFSQGRSLRIRRPGSGHLAGNSWIFSWISRESGLNMNSVSFWPVWSDGSRFGR